MKKLKEFYESLPPVWRGGIQLFGIFVAASLVVGTIVFLCTPGAHLNLW